MSPVHRYLLIALCTATLAGCATLQGPSHSSAASGLFLLQQDIDAKATATTAAPPTQSSLIVAQVEVAPYLAHDGIVYQTAPNRIVIADNNRWAAPLVTQIRQGLHAVLEQRLTQVNVRQPGLARQPDYRLSVHLQHFQGRYDGNAVISGSWHILNQQDQVIGHGDFKQVTALQDDGYPALVDALSRGWKTIKTSLARAIGKTLAGTRTAANSDGD